MASPRSSPKRIISEGIIATTHQQAGSSQTEPPRVFGGARVLFSELFGTLIRFACVSWCEEPKWRFKPRTPTSSFWGRKIGVRKECNPCPVELGRVIEKGLSANRICTRAAICKLRQLLTTCMVDSFLWAYEPMTGRATHLTEGLWPQSWKRIRIQASSKTEWHQLHWNESICLRWVRDPTLQNLRLISLQMPTNRGRTRILKSRRVPEKATLLGLWRECSMSFLGRSPPFFAVPALHKSYSGSLLSKGGAGKRWFPYPFPRLNIYGLCE